MPSLFHTSLFAFPGMFYALLLPTLLAQMFSLLLIPCLLKSTANIEGTGKALYCYFLQAMGIILMTIGGVPTIAVVLSGLTLPTTTYMSLLAIFAVGGLTFLWHDHTAHEIDPISRIVPHAIFLFSLKILGAIVILVSLLFIMLFTMVNQSLPAGWWGTPTAFLLYGVILSWSTRCPAESGSRAFSTASLSTKSIMATESAMKKGGKKRKRE